MKEIINKVLETCDDVLKSSKPSVSFEETGTVLHVADSIAYVSGLPNLKIEELLEFESGAYGVALNLDPDKIGVLLLSENSDIQAGSMVKPTGRLMDTPVGEELLGRVIDPTGRVLDDLGNLHFNNRLPIDRAAPAIMDRAPVITPLGSGIKVIDTLIPIGRGQRQLILGDRQTGKTSIAVDIICNQKDKNVLSIYCAIGQRGTAVMQVIDRLKRQNAMEHTILVVATGDNPTGLQYIAPYAATTIAEYFMHKGRDVVLVYDDLTRHAQVYREQSLLLRRPPGREAFPGDIFYLHSRLLERSTQLRSEKGGGSLTALPIVETQAENIAAYIPTNLISITDGQVYLSPRLFHRGVLPAVDIGKSVSRVGGKAQLPAYRAIASKLNLDYAQFEELETFARFGTRLDEQTRKIIDHGKRIREIFKQKESDPLRTSQQIAILFALNHGFFDDVEIDAVSNLEEFIKDEFVKQAPELCKIIDETGRFDDEINRQLSEALDQITKHVVESE